MSLIRDLPSTAAKQVLRTAPPCRHMVYLNPGNVVYSRSNQKVQFAEVDSYTKRRMLPDETGARQITSHTTSRDHHI